MTRVLPLPAPGQDEHRAFGGFDGFTLLRIELIEKRQAGKAPKSLVRFYRGLDIHESEERLAKARPSVIQRRFWSEGPGVNS